MELVVQVRQLRSGYIVSSRVFGLGSWIFVGQSGDRFLPRGGTWVVLGDVYDGGGLVWSHLVSETDRFTAFHNDDSGWLVAVVVCDGYRHVLWL